MQELYEIFKNSKGVSTDSREDLSGKVFFALRGERFDANDFIDQALDMGALHVVTTNHKYDNDPRATVVDDTLVALQELAKIHRANLKCDVLAITGTNGKTTTKELTAAVMRKKYRTVATEGNHNNHIGVPLTILSAPLETEYLIVEMGANHPGEIKALCEIAQPTIGLITNIGHAHIEGFGSFEGVVKTKAELYNYLMEHDGEIMIDGKNKILTDLIGDYFKVIPYNCYTGFIDGRGNVEGRAVINKDGFLDVQMDFTRIYTHLVGEYNLLNVLAAIAVGRWYGIFYDRSIPAVESYIPSNGRSQLVNSPRGNKLIVDAYNANPTSMNAALDSFLNSNFSNRAVILGSMKELGSESVSSHRDILSRLASADIKRAILVGPEFANLKADFPDFEYVDDVKDIIPLADSFSDSSILIKGSNSNRLREIVDYL